MSDAQAVGCALAIEIGAFKRVVDPSGTLVVIEAETDVPFSFESIDVLDLEGAASVCGEGFPFLMFGVGCELRVRDALSEVVLRTPDDVAVGDGSSPVRVEPLAGRARVVIVTSQPPPHASFDNSCDLGEPSLPTWLTAYENPALGRMSWAQPCPFPVKRIYFTHSTRAGMPRGGHAHLKLKQVLVSLRGHIGLALERTGQQVTVELTEPSEGILVTPVTWRDIDFSDDSCLLVLASDRYSEEDYIRDPEVFRAIGVL